MTTVYEIPTINRSQLFLINLANVQYKLTVRWINVEEGGWLLDIDSSDGSPIVRGIPLVTGVDLLGQYPQYKFGGKLIAYVAGDNLAAPDYESFGTEGRLYFVTE